MMKVTFGVLLVLVMAIPVSASVIPSPDSNYLLDTTAINPSIYVGEYLPSVVVSSALTVDFNPGSLWYPIGPSGDPGMFPWNNVTKTETSTLTIDFSNPVAAFGFMVNPWVSGDFTVNFFSPTGSLLTDDTQTFDMSSFGWQFVGAGGSEIGSVTITVANDPINTFAVTDMRFAPAPDPSTSLLLGTGLLGLGLVFRRRLA